ncbi:hypothetical protein U9M48_037585 [Paspalum notatum var. saurae]|uniref:Uncharacterized protein n=1 Tax=Paspalum notatum var. saurae TaxID=547442 RepID=A0AAQ3XA57_PASNO
MTRSSGRLLLLLLAVILVGTCGGGAGKQPTIRSAAAFGIPRAQAAFGVRRDVTASYCSRYWHLAAPYPLGSAAAIHIGNTNSCIAAYDFHPGTNDYYQLCIPSWVAVKADGATVAGEAAMEHAAASPATTVSGFTRLLHLRLQDDVVQNEMKRAPYKFSEVAGRAAIKIQAGTTTKELSPVDLSIILMTELRRRAEAHLGRELWSAVIAVPRHLNHDARQSVASAGWLAAGFHGGAKVLDRQIAAAAAYGHHEAQGDGKAIMVLRVGGRTSDAAIIKFINGAARLVHARDDIGLGGEDFTARIVDHIAELIMEQRQWDVRQDAEALRALTVACEHAKKALSDQEETLVQVELGGGGGFFSAPLTRAKLEELNHYLFEKALRLVDSVVMGAPPSWLPRDDSRKDMVDEIVLVGGSAKIPELRQLVKNYFHGRRPNSRKGVEPEDAIIKGTAILSRPEWAPYVEECFNHIHRPHLVTYIPRDPHKPRDPTSIREALLPLPLSECKGKELGEDCI